MQLAAPPSLVVRTAAGPTVWCALLLGLVLVPGGGAAAPTAGRPARLLSLSRASRGGGAALGRHVGAAAAASRAFAGNATEETKVDCGPLARYPNARPKNYADSRKTRYDAEAKATVHVTFSAGDQIPFECVPGYTTDGSRDGSRVFEVECSELGYYKPAGVCLKASKCGAVPNITNALPTGNRKGEDIEFACANGYSLDGEPVVAGGLGENQIFVLKCVEFSQEYEAFTGQCKPYAFVPATETVRVYNKAFGALFVVSCSGTLKKAFGAGQGPPAGLDAACGKIQDKALQSECAGLVAQIKADFESKTKARAAHDDKADKEWYEKKDKDRPGISTEAKAFCLKLWKLLEMPG